MKTAEEILSKHTGEEGIYLTHGTIRGGDALDAMKEYADQFKYDFSKSCKCKESPGATWCCNVCGLPTNEKILK